MSDTASRTSRSFIRQSMTPDRAPPVPTAGAVAWIRDNLFPSPVSSIVTLLGLLFLAWVTPPLVRWLFIDAVWIAENGDACRAPGAGACWAYVWQKLGFFMYGSYPREEVWRVNYVLLSGAALVVWMLWPDARGRGIAALAFFTLYPILAFGMLTGLSPFPTRWLPQSKTGFQIWGLIVFVLIAGAIALFLSRRWTGLAVAMIGFVVWAAIGWFWPSLGLAPVGTNLWGGIFVSLLVATVGIVFSLPLGILLALGRRSQMPVIRFLSVLLIEFVRGVPLITVLVMANTMLPLFVPQEWSPDRLLRPLIGVALFSAVYMAEVVRGGLQAIPKGQYEGAMAIGLSWSQMMQLIVLPQALVTVIPGIVNSFIALFKDTTLVAIVGIFDFLKAVETARLDPVWAGPSISTSGYVFAALFYFVFCFGMSRYSLMIERRHAAGRKR
jgi:general L-amino acid transport system permease protein